MGFELTAEQIDIQKAALEFAQKEFDPDLAIELDRNGQFPHSIWKKATELGFIGINYPEELGGQGLGLLETLLVIESFCKIDSGIGGALSVGDLGAEIVLEFGSKEQKIKILTPIVRGEKHLSVAFGDDEDGEDISSINTIVRESGDGYIIKGKKRFIWNTELANTFITICKDGSGNPITLLVEREREGLKIQSIEKIGFRMISYGDIEFNEVYVPYKNRIGMVGDAISHVKHYQQNSSLRFLAQALGTAQGALDRGLVYAKQRIQFGRKLSEFQVIRHKLAEMATGIEVLRLLIYKLASDFDRKMVDQKYFFVTKLETVRRLVEIVDEALQIFGGYGYMVEQSIEHYFRDTWAILSKLGTEEELKDSISELLLGPVPQKG